MPKSRAGLNVQSPETQARRLPRVGDVSCEMHYFHFNQYSLGIRLVLMAMHAFTIRGRWHYLEHDWWAEQGGYS